MANWLRDAVVYEIYPQSYYDTNGDGIGDLRGIIEKLDYIAACGFTAIWLNPINKSTFFDAGYDVTDFYSVAERYGTNEDYRALCEAAHARGMRVIFDLVAGHTSIKHPWFVASSRAEKNEYTNRYIWADHTFENEEGIAGYAQRDANYITNFFWCQPALNYGYAHPDPEKPWQLPVTHPDCVATKNELLRIIDFWTDLGTDAFRVDMAASLIKGDTDGSFMRAFWGEVRAHLDARAPEVLLISEWGFPDKAIASGFDLDFYLHSGQPAYTSLFRAEAGRNTTMLFPGHSFFALDGKGNINTYLDVIEHDLAVTKGKGYIGQITGNHDIPRLAYRRTPEELRCALVFLFTMPGVPFVYYGDEIGMDHIEGLPSKEGSYTRTGCRTPMQWNEGKNHGFSESDTPYLPTDSREGAPTVEAQLADPASLLHFVRALIRLHKGSPALHADGAFTVTCAAYPLCFERTSGEERIFVAINPSAREYTVALPAGAEILLSQNADANGTRATLRGASFVIAKVAK